MTERVLSDAEIAKIVEPHRGRIYESYDAPKFARAVEQAVLRKVAQIDVVPGEAMLNAVWNQLGIKEPAELVAWVTRQEREARKNRRVAERMAFLVGAEWASQKYMRDGPRNFYAESQSACEIRYPLPTQRVPRTVVLSDGVTVRASEAGGWSLRYSKGLQGETLGEHPPFGFAKTPADARLLADLVENPWTEEPDNG